MTDPKVPSLAIIRVWHADIPEHHQIPRVELRHATVEMVDEYGTGWRTEFSAEGKKVCWCVVYQLASGPERRIVCNQRGDDTSDERIRYFAAKAVFDAISFNDNASRDKQVVDLTITERGIVEWSFSGGRRFR